MHLQFEKSMCTRMRNEVTLQATGKSNAHINMQERILEHCVVWYVCSVFRVSRNSINSLQFIIDNATGFNLLESSLSRCSGAKETPLLPASWRKNLVSCRVIGDFCNCWHSKCYQINRQFNSTTQLINFTHSIYQCDNNLIKASHVVFASVSIYHCYVDNKGISYSCRIQSEQTVSYTHLTLPTILRV